VRARSKGARWSAHSCGKGSPRRRTRSFPGVSPRRPSSSPSPAPRAGPPGARRCSPRARPAAPRTSA